MLIGILAVVDTPAASAAALDGTITSDGPLTTISTSTELNCAVNHTGDSAGEFYGATACATLVAVDGTLFGPASIPAGSSASPRTPWDPISQQSTGTGTDADPFRVVTTVNGGDLRLVQTDTYVPGVESYGTRVAITNTAATARSVTLYRAGDCFLQDSDVGYGRYDADSGAVACTTGTAPDSRVEQWAPLTPGSHAMEAGYSSVWAAIGTQQPFGDTCLCDTAVDNGAGLSWSTTIQPGVTVAFSHLTAFSPTGATQVQDSDGDSLPDSWERPVGDGPLNLSAYGATPDKPDVFVQVSYVRAPFCDRFFCLTTNRQPSLAAMRDIQRAFDQHGIRLHIDAGPLSLMDPDSGATWGSLARGGNSIDGPTVIPGAGSAGFEWNGTYDQYRRRLVDPARDRVFHLMLYVGQIQSGGGLGGLARGNVGTPFGGKDAMFARDAFPQLARVTEAATVMHELGHNLGLSHGGSVDQMLANNKPNYPSVMNYLWQQSGTYKQSALGLIDYSEGTLDSLDKRSLSESAGLGPDGPANDIGTKWKCTNALFYAVGGDHRSTTASIVPSVRNLDWDCDGTIDPGVHAVPSINLPRNSDLPAGPDVLTDFDDWHGLIFDGGGALGAAADPAASESISPVEEATQEELRRAAGDLQTVGVDAPGELSIQANTSAPVELTLTNHHATARTYALDVQADGVTLSGLPASVTLAAGEARTLVGTLQAGAADDDAFSEVDVTSDEPTDAASGITDIHVVDGVVPDQPGTTGIAGGPSTSPSGGVKGATKTASVAGVVVIDDAGVDVRASVDAGAPVTVRRGALSRTLGAAAGTRSVLVRPRQGSGRSAVVKVKLAAGQLAVVVVSKTRGRLRAKASRIAAGQRKLLVASAAARIAVGSGRARRVAHGALVGLPANTRLTVDGRRLKVPAGQLVVLTRERGRARLVGRSI